MKHDLDFIPRRRTRRAALSVLTLALALFAIGCTSTPRTVADTAFAGDGVHVRLLRLRVAPSHTQDFETIMKACVEAANAAKLPSEYSWLCYRESPGRYWIITFSDTAGGFLMPRTLEGFVSHVADAAGDLTQVRVRTLLAWLEYETEWEVHLQQKSAWSTVEGMSTSTHPKARIMERTVRPGMERAFAAALTRRTAFFAEHAYPLPIEGFVTLSGLPGRQLQVVFPVDWPSFHGTDSFHAFVQRQDAAAREDYASRKAALMPTMASAEYHDGAFLPELSRDG